MDAKVLKRGESIAQLTIKGVNVDLYVASPETWGALLLIRTGSAQHNIKLSMLAQKRGMMHACMQLRITIKDLDRRRLNVLIEKAINCRACGACTSLCRTGALQVDEESVYVDFTKCNKCQRCIKTKPFRGVCVIRNYSPKIISLVKA